MTERVDPLAYGHYYEEGERGIVGDSARGFIKDTFKILKDNFHSHQGQQSGQQPYESGSYSVRADSLKQKISNN